MYAKTFHNCGSRCPSFGWSEPEIDPKTGLNQGPKPAFAGRLLGRDAAGLLPPLVRSSGANMRFDVQLNLL